ncbi:SDR family NAD(P)-dependent oxidoreductase [Manganibacter manganicus]|nr:SDR family NAD(P)-dependent oxidoreductase [Pseudaminobacter manganicus]
MLAARMGSDRSLAAVTGATGFLGRHLVAALLAAGWHVRALSRSGALPFGDADIVAGDLEDEQALGRLVEGADVVIHAAGIVKAADAAAFARVNVQGAARLVRLVTTRAPGAHFILISSLAAREPGLSPYAASKRAAEDEAAVAIAPERLMIVRPPALYGAHDRETLALFKAARLPVTPLLADGNERIALMHAGDAAAQIVALAAARMPGRFCLADTQPAGYTLRTILSEAGHAQGRHPHFIRLPAAALKAAGQGASLAARLSGRAIMLSPGKVREILHADWSVDPDTMPRDLQVAPRDLVDGFAQTVAWYREAGWL